jgi:hypothetical protein
LLVEKIPAWKENDDDSNNNRNSKINLYYSRSGLKINDIFKPAVSDGYAFVLNNRRSSISHEVKRVEVLCSSVPDAINELVN